MALKAHATGRKKYAAWTIIGAMRWNLDIAVSKGVDDFKISNDYIALLSRMVPIDKPALTGFFNTKKMLRVRSS